MERKRVGDRERERERKKDRYMVKATDATQP